MAVKYGIFKLTINNGLDLLINDFDLPGFETHLDMSNKIFDFTTAAIVGLERIIPIIADSHIQADSSLNINTFTKNQMVVLNEIDIYSINQEIVNCSIYYNPIPTTPINRNIWITSAQEDGIGMSKVFTLNKIDKSTRFVLRKYDSDAYSINTLSGLTDVLLNFKDTS